MSATVPDIRARYLTYKRSEYQARTYQSLFEYLEQLQPTYYQGPIYQPQLPVQLGGQGQAQQQFPQQQFMQNPAPGRGQQPQPQQFQQAAAAGSSQGPGDPNMYRGRQPKGKALKSREEIRQEKATSACGKSTKIGHWWSDDRCGPEMILYKSLRDQVLN